MKTFLTLSLLRIITVIVILSGAVGSLALTLQAGRNNNSVLLKILFSLWVLSPFIALLVANNVSRKRTVPTRVSHYILMLVLPIVSIIIYSGIFSTANTKPAFVFIVVPLISWLIMMVFIPLAVSRSKRQSKM